MVLEDQAPKFKSSSFSRDLADFMVSCNIPLNKASKPKFIQFMKKYSSRNVPHQSTLRRQYGHIIYDDIMKDLLSKAAGKKIWVSLDETTDVEQRYVVAFCLWDFRRRM